MDNLNASLSKGSPGSSQYGSGHFTTENAANLIYVLLEQSCTLKAIIYLNKVHDRAFTPTDPEVEELAGQLHQGTLQKLSAIGFHANVTNDPSRRHLVSRILDNLTESVAEDLGLPGNQLASRPGSDHGDNPTSSMLVAQSSLTHRQQNQQLFAMLDNPGRSPCPLETQLLLFQQTPEALQPYVNPNVESRYYKDFIELDRIGKGGFGQVFKVHHKLEGSPYAIKKIPIKRNTMRRIESRGQAEIDNLFGEIRALASLDHPNIVRYHSVWLEQEASSYPARPTREPSRLLTLTEGETEEDDEDYYLGSQYEGETYEQGVAESLRDLSIQDDDGIVFGEDSVVSQHDTGNSLRSLSKTESIRNRSRRASQATTSSTKSKRAFTDEEDDVETIERDLASIREEKKIPLPYNNYTMYVQTALHCISLAEYIQPMDRRRSVPIPDSPTDNELVKLRHCFHVRISIRILLLLLKTISYVHAKNLVHRDLKPANILISAYSGDQPEKELGCVGMGECPECQDISERRNMFLNLRLADFGLVAKRIHPETFLDFEATQKAVGTLMYTPERPDHSSDITKLDVFALGIIAVELLVPFDTDFERSTILGQVRKGILPDMVKKQLSPYPALQTCIEGMIANRNRLGCSEARELLESALV